MFSSPLRGHTPASPTYEDADELDNAASGLIDPFGGPDGEDPDIFGPDPEVGQDELNGPWETTPEEGGMEVDSAAPRSGVPIPPVQLRVFLNASPLHSRRTRRSDTYVGRRGGRHRCLHEGFVRAPNQLQGNIRTDLGVKPSEKGFGA